MSETSSPRTRLGTLLWIGDPTVLEFQDAFQFCTSQVAQLALRSDLEEALRRPAADVRCILLARATRQNVEQRLINRLAESYPQASILSLLGTLCEGMKIENEPTPGANRLYWHRWYQVLPDWLAACGAVGEPPAKRVRSVAVVAASSSNGEPLLELAAESAGATVIWCKCPDPQRVRNVDAVWWDDSAAAPVSYRKWRERIAPFAAATRKPQHAWIVNSPRYDQHRHATQGGIDLVVSKPYRIESLLRTLEASDGSHQHDTHTASTIGLRAA